jgi:hypothetical protein
MPRDDENDISLREFIELQIKQIRDEQGKQGRRIGSVNRRVIRLQRAFDSAQVEKRTRRAVLSTLWAGAGAFGTLLFDRLKK